MITTYLHSKPRLTVSAWPAELGNESVGCFRLTWRAVLVRPCICEKRSGGNSSTLHTPRRHIISDTHAAVEYTPDEVQTPRFLSPRQHSSPSCLPSAASPPSRSTTSSLSRKGRMERYSTSHSRRDDSTTLWYLAPCWIQRYSTTASEILVVFRTLPAALRQRLFAAAAKCVQLLRWLYTQEPPVRGWVLTFFQSLCSAFVIRFLCYNAFITILSRCHPVPLSRSG